MVGWQAKEVEMSDEGQKLKVDLKVPQRVEIKSAKKAPPLTPPSPRQASPTESPAKKKGD